MKIVKIPITCSTCRRCKESSTYIFDGYTYICKYQEKPFSPFGKKGCEHWLPSKSDLRIWLNSIDN